MHITYRSNIGHKRHKVKEREKKKNTSLTNTMDEQRDINVWHLIHLHIIVTGEQFITITFLRFFFFFFMGGVRFSFFEYETVPPPPPFLRPPLSASWIVYSIHPTQRNSACRRSGSYLCRSLLQFCSFLFRKQDLLQLLFHISEVISIFLQTRMI